MGIFSGMLNFFRGKSIKPQSVRVNKERWSSLSERNRRIAEIQARPLWLSLGDRIAIKELYLEARALEEADGVKRHVDHIAPLQGKKVCGLHVPWNLQILTATDNLRKSNRV
jgi:hypothetical protein